MALLLPRRYLRDDGFNVFITSADVLAALGLPPPLVGVANTVPYFDTATSMALAPFTAAGRALVGLADPSAADEFAYFTGPGAAAYTPLSAFSRGLLGSSSSAAWQSALGLRQILTGPTNFFFNTSAGNDNNPGTSGSPWASPAPLASRYDFGNQAVTLNLQNNPTSTVQIPAWTGGGSLTLELGGHSIASTTGSAITPIGLMPGRFNIQNGSLGATGTSHAAAIDMLNGAGQVFVSGVTFNACTFAYVWLTGAGLGASTVVFVDTNQWAATAAGQLFGVISVFPCTFIGGFTGRPATTNLTGNLTFSGSPMAILGGYIYSTTAGLATAVWQKNGFTSTPNTALVLTSQGGPAIQGYNDFTGFV